MGTSSAESSAELETGTDNRKTIKVALRRFTTRTLTNIKHGAFLPEIHDHCHLIKSTGATQRKHADCVTQVACRSFCSCFVACFIVINVAVTFDP